MREALPFLGIVEEESPDPLDTEKRGFQPFFFLLSGGGSVLLLDTLGEGGGCLLAGVGSLQSPILLQYPQSVISMTPCRINSS